MYAIITRPDWRFHCILLLIFVFASLPLVCISSSSWKTNHDFFNCSCGQFTSERRIIDGNTVNDAAFPWLVGILPGRGPLHSPLCYGALISDRHILTAASCVHKKKRNDITVYFYGNDISKRRRRSVADIEINDEYGRINHDNNLAIVTLAVPLDLEKIGINRIAPICIINPFLFTGRLSKMKGLMIKRQDHKTVLVPGSKFYFGIVPVKLYRSRNPACSNIFSDRTTDKFLCYDGDSKPACYGDEGSPLTITVSETGQIPVTTGGRYYVLGIYSKGYGCDGYQQGKSGYDVSTNILNHTDWIVRKTRNGYFCS